jgi:ABC-type multidrug transport system ATPase subunit
VLARELAGEINVLIAANPVFGLDFAAVREIHGRLRDVRDRGGAVLLVSEDLDELLELADRIVVMSEGRIVFETPAASAERQVLGAHMGGGHPAPQAERKIEQRSQSQSLSTEAAAAREPLSGRTEPVTP